MDCLNDLIGVTRCEKGCSRSGLYLEDFEELSGVLTNCCGRSAYDDAYRKICQAGSELWADLVIFASSELTVNHKQSYNIGYKRQNATDLTAKTKQGVMLTHTTLLTGNYFQINRLRVDTEIPKAVSFGCFDSAGVNLWEVSGYTNQDVKIDKKIDCADMPVAILHDSKDVKRVLDICPCSGWKDEYNIGNTYACNQCGNSRGKPKWANLLMLGGVEIDNISELSAITKASKNLRGLNIDISVGCDRSDWVCANNFNKSNPLHLMIAKAQYYKAAILVMKSAKFRQVVDRASILASEHAPEFIAENEEIYTGLVTKIINYIKTNHKQMNTCFSCGKPRFKKVLGV